MKGVNWHCLVSGGFGILKSGKAAITGSKNWTFSFSVVFGSGYGSLSGVWGFWKKVLILGPCQLTPFGHITFP